MKYSYSHYVSFLNAFMSLAAMAAAPPTQESHGEVQLCGTPAPAGTDQAEA